MGGEESVLEDRVDMYVVEQTIPGVAGEGERRKQKDYALEFPEPGHCVTIARPENGKSPAAQETEPGDMQGGEGDGAGAGYGCWS